MSTTVAPNRPRSRSQQPRVSGRGRDDRAARETEYDLLTAALIGITIGAGVTFMLRRGPTGRRPVSPVVERLGQGAAWAGKRAARMSRSGGRWAARQSGELWDRVPHEEIREHVSEYMGEARDAIDHAVASELQSLRKAIRRQRKRLGV